MALIAHCVPERSPLRQAITDHTRADEHSLMKQLSHSAAPTPEESSTVSRIARQLVQGLRANKSGGIVQDLVQKYDLSTEEGVALMCLAEALLRIPDNATRDALIRDKIGNGNWMSQIDRKSPLFVNAATWGLVVSGKTLSAKTLSRLPSTLANLTARCSAPTIRQGVNQAIRLMGRQFVTGQTIEEALKHSQGPVSRGYRYSYDMLGEAAMNMADADRYYRDYETAIHAIGKSARDLGIYAGPGISVKLSALHPRYARLQRERALTELAPRLRTLAKLASQYNIGFNIDAEESERLELSLDLLEILCADPALRSWNGLGFVVQAYQKRAPSVLTFLIDLARQHQRRLMIRLVKGAYWDSEIKRAQVDGQTDFPVFTEKNHTDIAYLACARTLLSAPDAVYPQFATHNAQSLAAIYAMAGPEYTPDSYEFQCLHGMGETLYNQVIGPKNLNRPVRIYAPVGTHETLLAYLVRRLLENGANSSFVNRIQDPSLSLADLTADPVSLLGHTHTTGILPPHDLFLPERPNSRGMDLNDENTLRSLKGILDTPLPTTGGDLTVINPANHADTLGAVTTATPNMVNAAVNAACDALQSWSSTPADTRATILERAADTLEEKMPQLMGIVMREAGKTLANAIAEIREAVDFLRYYGAQARRELHDTHPLGAIVCISPWNFPLAIFIGQVAAALAAGNTVLAKPAEETPLIALMAIAILHDAGIPQNALHVLPGGGETGAALVANTRISGVVFTGSTEVAHIIQKQLANRLTASGTPLPLIAETGGQNAMVVDSSALTEQVVRDVLASAFDSAGQRCSALRVLCLQEDSADHVLTMLKGAMDELKIGNPAEIDTDIGPVISTDAQKIIVNHVNAMRAQGFPIYQPQLPTECANGTFVAPTLIEIHDLSALKREVFGPVLHVLRYHSHERAALMQHIRNTGYALTFGLHSRIDSTTAELTASSNAGNIYVNRNVVGAIVGSQPFGGHGLSGTGPKAGGPLYLRRLLSRTAALDARFHHAIPSTIAEARPWLDALAPASAQTSPAHTPLGTNITLPGPVGESNTYSLTPRGAVLCAGPTEQDLRAQIEASLATGNTCILPAALWRRLPPPPQSLSQHIVSMHSGTGIDVTLFNGTAEQRRHLASQLPDLGSAIIGLHVPHEDGTYPLEWLVLERSISTDTTAAGGNAALMAQV
ncbi:bifunctional proline dehydrogenase/L-glutamate gamma-semialdehyde dehydrogenase PutA [Neokomagataea thailandica]|uniref:Bifunctional protein PutA n=1 Tax=Neokomagataea tanensis NBRC 106556 TaxID=1223519 RepID=A0ABQ0QI58_9PROT|nr:MULTISPECIES: bifunctional proline dehydrogenase/L-glutamate gamma-semialdehyde dehydrogenase PutA [Neokomagataea]GBR45666.1 bifunctional proline dehydrogenase/pyrroline-5-carboxylate dehydrogenase [Neokomagataea tanensis NBRC 106556]